MQLLKRPFDKVDQLSNRDKAYQAEDQALRPFYKYPVNLESFEQVFEDRRNASVDRALLVRTLEKQYDGLASSALVKENTTALLNEKTFTVITAHQPSLITGPLYFIYKIASAINLSRKLNETYPDKKVVPLFIIGGEDHDFEEINYFNLFGNKLVWENDESGSVGRMKTESLTPVLEKLENILGDSPNANLLKDYINRSFKSFDTYGKATAAFVAELFSDHGLLVLNMDDKALKEAFIPIIRKEIFEEASKSIVDQSKEALSDAGFSGQAYAREINFFYLSDGVRNRIERDGDVFQVVDTDFRFDLAAMEAEISRHPDRFSPNVIMRPLYQETILPNLAYIGGGGELAYWLERKTQFEFFELPFPMLIRRNSVMWIDSSSFKKIQNLDLSMDDLFEDTEISIKRFVKKQADEPLSILAEKEQLKNLFDQITEKAEAIDKSLVGAVQAEQARQLKSLDNLEQRILRAEKQKHEVSINQIRKIKEKFFPNRGLQERHDNFMSLYLKQGPTMIEYLINTLNPLEKEFLIVID